MVTEQLKNDDKVQLVGFGTFEVSKRAAREGRNPQTGKTMKIEACKAPKFKAGKALKTRSTNCGIQIENRIEKTGTYDGIHCKCLFIRCGELRSREQDIEE